MLQIAAEGLGALADNSLLLVCNEEQCFITAALVLGQFRIPSGVYGLDPLTVVRSPWVKGR